MAQIFGQRNKYLIWMDWINRVAALLIGIIFLWAAYALVTINFGKNLSIIGWVIVIIIYAPLFYLIKNNGFTYYIESKNYLQGRKGEYGTYFELLNLPDAYLVFQDVKFPKKYSNIDFVVVGPAGIFAIEVKSHDGIIGFNGTELMRNGVSIREKDFLKQTMQEALDLHQHMQDNLNMDNFVIPLLVFSNSKAIVKFGLKPVQKVYVIKKGYLVDAITGGKNKLSPETIEKYKRELLKLVYPNRMNKN